MTRIEQEKKTVGLMIRLYCHKKEKNTTLCPQCEALLQYAYARLDRCRFGKEKTACKLCPTHCYKPEMRKQIQIVMQFSGPRMIFYAPLQALRHMLNLWTHAFR